MNRAACSGVVVGIGAPVFAWLPWRASRKRPEPAQEAARFRPDTAVSFEDAVFHYRPPDPGSRYVQAATVFELANDGMSAARARTFRRRAIR